MPLRASENKNSAIERIEEEVPLIEVEEVPVVFAEGPAKVEIEGDNIEVTYFRYSHSGGRRIRVPVIKMIRPMRNCGKGGLWELISRALPHIRSDRAH